MTRQPIVRRHVYEAKHFKSKFIGCMDHYNNHGNIELHVNRLTATSFSNFGARYEQSTASYKCNQVHGWISHNHMYKTSLLKYLKISMDLSVASSLHGIHPSKDGMA